MVAGYGERVPSVQHARLRPSDNSGLFSVHPFFFLAWSVVTFRPSVVTFHPDHVDQGVMAGNKCKLARRVVTEVRGVKQGLYGQLSACSAVFATNGVLRFHRPLVHPVPTAPLAPAAAAATSCGPLPPPPPGSPPPASSTCSPSPRTSPPPLPSCSCHPPPPLPLRKALSEHGRGAAPQALQDRLQHETFPRWPGDAGASP